MREAEDRDRPDRWTARTAERAASLPGLDRDVQPLRAAPLQPATAASRPRARSAIRRSSRWCRSASSGLGSCRRFRTSPARARSCCSCFSAISSPASATQAAWWFQYFAGSAAQATAIGIVGTAAVGVLLLVTVEDQLNAVWRVTVPRPWVQRVLAYWTLITMGPLLIGTSLTLSTYLNNAARRAGLDPDAIAQFASGWPHLLARAVCRSCSNGSPVRCSICIIPNCAVRWRDAMLGATVASVSIEMLKIGFVDLYRLAVVVSDRLRRDRHDPDLSAVDVRVVDGGAARRRRRREPADLEGGRAVPSSEQRRRAARFQPVADRRAGSRRSAAAKPTARPIWPPNSASRPRLSTSI